VSIRRILLPATIAVGSLEALLLALETAFADALSTVVVVHGTVDRFCGGMDLSAMVREDARVGLQLFARVLHRLQQANKPTIAAVEGPAIGGGVGIAAACDVVVASSTATFALPEALFGLLPGAVLPVLLDRMRPQKARLLALLGRSHAADWAEINGLVDEVASPSDIEGVVLRRARDLARVAPERVCALRSWIHAIPTLAPTQAVERGAEVTACLVNDDAVKTRVRRFVEEGTPPWMDR
jgi:enoyl-CoA hydratase/carnithine racemase